MIVPYVISFFRLKSKINKSQFKNRGRKLDQHTIPLPNDF